MFLTCRCKLLEMLKDLSQYWHLYGCSPVCVLRWRVKFADRGKTLPQNLHVYRSFNFPLPPTPPPLANIEVSDAWWWWWWCCCCMWWAVGWPGCECWTRRAAAADGDWGMAWAPPPPAAISASWNGLAAAFAERGYGPPDRLSRSKPGWPMGPKKGNGRWKAPPRPFGRYIASRSGWIGRGYTIWCGFGGDGEGVGPGDTECDGLQLAVSRNECSDGAVAIVVDVGGAWLVDTSSSPVTLTGEPEVVDGAVAPFPEFGVDVFRGVDGEQLRSSRFLVETLKSRGCSPAGFLFGRF